jgi:hypothetical protein
MAERQPQDQPNREEPGRQGGSPQQGGAPGRQAGGTGESGQTNPGRGTDQGGQREGRE